MIKKNIFLLKTTFNYKEFNVTTLLLLIAFSFFFFFPVIYGSGFYADDVYRINVSSEGFIWHNNGRLFATDIAQLYSNNKSLIIDVSPLAWVLSIIIIGLSSKLIYCKLNKNFQEYSLPLSIVFLLNPFLIQNLLYRFDNLGMFVGLFFVVLAFSLNDTRWGILVKTVLLLISLNFYQSFANLYIALVALESLLMGCKNIRSRKIVKYLITAAGIYFLVSILYYVELKLVGISGRGELLTIEANSITLMIKNYLKAFNQFVVFWSSFKLYIYIAFPMLALSLIISKANLKFYILLVVAFGLIFISTLGMMALIKFPSFEPRALHYFSPVLMLMTIILIAGNKNLKWIMLAPAFACFIFSYRVGNMQKVQSDFEKPIAQSLVIDLLSEKTIQKYYSIGSMPYSNFIKNIRSNTPFDGFMSRGGWHTVGVVNEYAPKGLVAFEWSSQARKTYQKFKEKESSLEMVYDRSPFYKIYKSDNEGWVVWQ